MPNTYLILTNADEVKAVLNSPTWYPYARFLDRQDDAPIFNETGVKMVQGELWVNAGEWNVKGYINEEWLKPAFVYIKHRCDGCSYPPNMCCLQPSPRYIGDSFYQIEDWGGDYDDPNEDSYQAGYDELFDLPAGVNPKTLVA